MKPIDRSYTTYYWSAIVGITLSCTIFELFDVEEYRDLKILYSRSLKMVLLVTFGTAVFVFIAR